MKTLFCLADVHSFYDEMIEALNEEGYDINNPDHIIIHCGDLLDRGPKPIECLKFINNIPDNRKILIRGNHEDLLEEVFDRGKFLWHDIQNGTMKTIYKIANIDRWENDFSDYMAITKCMENDEVKKYLNSLVDFFELENYIFVHGWLPEVGKDNLILSLKYDNWREGDWKKAGWLNGMEQWSHGRILKNKTVVCGHWHTSWGHSRLHNLGVEFKNKYTDSEKEEHFEPFIDNGIIALDACAVYSGKINCHTIEIEEDKWP